MNVFVWFSNKSRQTGEMLTAELETALDGQNFTVSCGKLPPRGFNGVVVSWNGNYTTKFKWENRTMELINDPRTTKIVSNKKDMFSKLIEEMRPGEVIFPTSVLGLSALDAFDGAPSITLLKNEGSSTRVVHTSDEYRAALLEGFATKVPKEFTAAVGTVRVHVVNGYAVAAQVLQETGDPLRKLAVQILGEGASEEALDNAVASMVHRGTSIPDGAFSEWVADEINEGDLVILAEPAVRAVQALGLSIGCVEFSNNQKVSNVLLNPALTTHENTLPEVALAISEMVAARHKPATERLLDLVNTMTEENNNAAAQAVIDFIADARGSIGE